MKGHLRGVKTGRRVILGEPSSGDGGSTLGVQIAEARGLRDEKAGESSRVAGRGQDFDAAAPVDKL
jgi:hypothetical protein